MYAQMISHILAHLSQGSILPFEEVNLIQQEMFVKLCLVPDPTPAENHGNCRHIYGGFHKWGYHLKWLVYKVKSHLEMDDLGVPLS